MIRAQLRDAALSAAKGQGHPEVEPRHVWYAVARRVQFRPGLAPALEAAETALEPRGEAVGVPVMGPEAAELLASLESEEEAVSRMLEALGVTPEPVVLGGDGAPQPDETVADVLAELDRLIGLDEVKSEVRDLIAVVQVNAERERAGLKPVNPSLHLVFTGPPGTGKTTVARLVARLYKATGALPDSRFTEAARSDLVAGFVGQTALKVREVVDRTRPGVLFIDEAYAMAPKSHVDFGHEAVSTLVKLMEDHRDELAVIVAGYEEPMAEFVASNPGLRSRLKTYITFPDYSPTELVEIFRLFADDSAIELAGGVLEKAEDIFARAAREPDFGNARFARSLFEEAFARMAARAAQDGRVDIHEVITLAPDDVAMELDDLLA